MRIAVFSDVHANRAALTAVRRDVECQHIDWCWFLGDVVGYGPDPVEAVRWLVELLDSGTLSDDGWVLGNHEAIMAGWLTEMEQAAVNEMAQVVLNYHRQQLAQSPELETFWQAAFVHSRAEPRSHQLDGIQHTLTHAGQADRHLFRYIYAWQTDFYLRSEFSWLQMQYLSQARPQVQWFGHTHVPTLVYGMPQADGFQFEAVRIMPGEVYPLKGNLVMVNPGSVGQPRDLNRRAAYAILDTVTQTVTFRRVAYDWRESVRRLWALPVPDRILDVNGEAGLVPRLQQAQAIKETPAEWLAHYRLARGAPDHV